MKRWGGTSIRKATSSPDSIALSLHCSLKLRLLLSEGQVVEAWKLLDKAKIFRTSGISGQEQKVVRCIKVSAKVLCDLLNV
jgi:hypothetical protein